MARRIVLSSDRDEPSGSTEDLTIEYAEALNEQQYAAATAGEGPLLIVAGAGTGKTRTLIYRLAYLVETGTRPQQIVLLTFTRRAANDMTARASNLLDGRCEKVRGGTFHAFCLEVLRQHAEALGFPRNFTVLDAADAADVLSIIRTRGEYGDGEERFPQKNTLYSMFSSATNRDETLGETITKRYPQFTSLHAELKALRDAYRRYKKEHGLMDFDDLLERTLELLETDDVRHQVASRCRHVLVDEYQDTNALQAELVKKFSSVHGNVTVVGDDAQSIYKFRGADFRNIFRFPDEFDDTEVVKLEHNYRSTQPILDLANRVIEQAERSYDKTLFTEKTEGELPALVPAADGDMEARFVAEMVLRLREDGVPLSDVAVLFRSSHNAYDLEVELNQRNIPFVKYGGMKLNEAAHIKDVLAHLKVVENPQDAASWNRALQLIHGIGPKTAQSLIEWTTEAAGDPLTLGDGAPFSDRYAARLKQLFSTLRHVRSDDTSVTEQVEAILDYYQPLFENKYADDHPKRAPDLEHLAGLAANHESRQRFLSSLTLDPIELTALDQETGEDDEPPLVLSTIHSAKGLEFHTVFLIRALDGTIPSRHALREPGGVDEELRLFYVAVTRAEEDLFISYPMTQYRRGQGEYMTTPSRFVEDLPDDVLEPVQLVEEDAVDENAPDAPEGGDTLPSSRNGEAPAPPESTRDDGPPDDPADADGLPF
ncbi:DNA helicase-2/ATP-dependent DNA helicase PcrA [Salinibacter ruber]|uniref:ATP-dependent helicase n=1 Tax=Salinibacter ruber TaxID=146919 RepID=UPI002073574D|nr:ATP-dependent helicase [Salinibacter ruber]MCS3829925.1 DNA helicase-2/ATP-dependent DNA helicase PcrA [Salinibacter ruber]MCS4097897.1 DNA helicase-2/ATP-dependent DNA helicase PcrA [Salinibacter ruber]